MRGKGNPSGPVTPGEVLQRQKPKATAPGSPSVPLSEPHLPGLCAPVRARRLVACGPLAVHPAPAGSTATACRCGGNAEALQYASRAKKPTPVRSTISRASERRQRVQCTRFRVLLLLKICATDRPYIDPMLRMCFTNCVHARNVQHPSTVLVVSRTGDRRSVLKSSIQP